MKHMEDELREALRRQSPPQRFTERLLEEVSRRSAFEAGRRNRSRTAGWLVLRWAGVAAVLFAMIAGVRFQSHRSETARSVAAKEQLLLALRITAAELRFAQEKVFEIGREGRPSAPLH